MATKKKADKKKTVKKKAQKRSAPETTAVSSGLTIPVRISEPSSGILESECPECESPSPAYQITAFECSACGCKFPEQPESENPSLMYGVVVHNFTEERRAYVDGSSLFAAHKVGEHTVVAIKCIQNISDPVFTRDVGWDPECFHALREFCKKCKVKFQPQWVFAWLD